MTFFLLAALLLGLLLFVIGLLLASATMPSWNHDDDVACLLLGAVLMAEALVGLAVLNSSSPRPGPLPRSTSPTPFLRSVSEPPRPARTERDFTCTERTF